MKQTGLKRITAWLLLFALALASGCGKNTGPKAASPAEGSGENGTEGKKEPSMGRYLERQIELPEEFEMAKKHLRRYVM